MAGSWGSKKNGVRIGFFYDSINVNAAGTKAQITGGRIRIDRDVNISDSTNALSWSGSLVSNGSTSNLNVSGSGAKTIKYTGSGSWVTLSSTSRVRASVSVAMSGVNYAGGTLYVSVSVSFPLAGDGGTVSPTIPEAEEAEVPNDWEDELAPDYSTEPYIEHAWAVRLPGAPKEYRDVAARDITVTLDGGKAPYGEAKFKVPVSYLAEEVYDLTKPLLQPVVQIDAGWQYHGLLNVHTLFSGVVTDRRLKLDAAGPYVEITAQTYEALLDYPSHLAASVSSGYTTVQEFYSAQAFYRKPAWVEPATNDAPDAAGLAEYRALGIEVNDGVDEFLRSCAGALGQWMRGGLAYSTPTVECVTDPYPYRRLNEIDLSAFSDAERVENLDEWANILRLTAQWTDASSGDTKSKRRTYTASTVTSGTGAVRARDVTINVKPPSGATPPATWAPALKWLRRVNEASRGSWTGTCRALWWIRPRTDGVLITGSPVEDTAGQVQRVAFMVDQGLMSINWNVVHA